MYNLTFKAPQSYKKYRYVVLFLTTFLNNPVVNFFAKMRTGTQENAKITWKEC